MKWRCEYCGSHWKLQHLESGQKCPSCGAQVPTDQTDDHLEIRMEHSDSFLRTKRIIMGLRNGEKEWEEEIDYLDCVLNGPRELKLKLAITYPLYSGLIRTLV